MAGNVKKNSKLVSALSRRQSTIGRQGLRQSVELLKTSFKHKSL